MAMSNYLLKCLFTIIAYFVISTAADEAIINAPIASVDEFPYQVSLQFENGRHFCGGAIIEDIFVITAASCVILRNGEFRPGRITILAGTNDLRRTTHPAVKVEVRTIYALKEYKPNDAKPIANIAVLRLTESMGLSLGVSQYGNIKALQLPKGNRAFVDGKLAKIAGWGWDWIGRNFMHTTDARLRYTNANILTSEECKKDFKIEHNSSGNINSNDQICARVKQQDSFKTYGVCYGDIGSGLVTDDATLIGILSKNSENCAEKTYPAVYTRVSHYLHFIENAMKGHKAPAIRVYDLISSHL